MAQPTLKTSSVNARIVRFEAWQKLSLEMIKRSVVSALLIGIGLFILFALLSFSPNDPSWASVSSDTRHITNLMGGSGAWFAGVFFAFLGYAAWLVPLFFLYELMSLWWIKHSAPRILRYPAVIFALLSLAATLTLFLPDFFSVSELNAGGIFGVELSQSVALIVGKWLGLLFTAVLFVLAFSYGFQVRWLTLWRSRENLFAPRVLKPDSLTQTIAFDTDRTMQPVRQTTDVKTNMSEVIKQSFKKTHTPTKTEPDRKASDKSTTEISDKNPVDALVSPVAVQQSSAQRNSTSKQADAVQTAFQQLSANPVDLPVDGGSQSEQVATTDVLPTYPIPSRPLSQTVGVSRGDKASDVQKFSHSSDTRIDPVFDDLLEMTQPVTEIAQQVNAKVKSTPVNVLDTLNELSNERQDLPSVFGGRHAQGMPRESIGKQSTQTISAHSAELSIAEKAKRAKLERLADDVIPSLIEDEPVLIKPSKQRTKLGNPSNPNGGLASSGSVAKSVKVDEDQMDLLNDMPSLVPEPSFSAAAMAVTEGETPEDIFEVLEAQMNALSEQSDSSNINTVNAVTNAPTNVVTHESENELTIDSSVSEVVPAEANVSIEKPQQPDYFTETKGSRAYAKAAHRASLPPLPPIELLEKPDPNQKPSYSQAELARLSELLEIKLNEFNIKASVVSAQPGPVVTRFEVDLAPGVKASKVTNISRDLARSLSMASVRVVEVIPGKPYIGIEVPNLKREMVRLYELLTTEEYNNPKAGLSMALGKDIAGRPVVTDLAKAPHMLVAGTTGSGKSVAVNAMLLSLLLKYTPEQLRLILIDPKQLELANYNDIPHLLTEVVTDMKDAASALNWCVTEMERRYKFMAFLKVRKLSDYNKKIAAAEKQGEDFLDPLWRPNDDVSTDKPPRLKQIPLVVVVADEFADMIMQVGKQAEELITRLAQKSRAAGIHLILATQRPSVDVITGLIKANIPTRVALRVNSKVDSRTILDSGGAEDMLGNGDMLFLGPGKIEPERAHGAFISDDEVNTICDAWRERGSPDYVEDMMSNFDIDGAGSGVGSSEGKTIKTGETDSFYDDAVAFVMETRKVSASSIQRKFSIGYNRAARIVDAMEAAGLVSSMGKSGKREILM